MRFRISEEEHKRLLDLYATAQTTPVLVFGVGPGQDTASVAWDRVREYMNELGRKYGYNPKTAEISVSAVEFEAEPI